MNTRIKKFLSYYKPYRGLFLADLICALLVAAIALLIPLCIRYITQNLLEGQLPDAEGQIYRVGALMVILVGIHTACNLFVSYQGHVMGAKMEADMRTELFEHYQKLSFRFYDEQRTGQLMTRLTNDSFALSELYHHGPEDVVISFLSFGGALIILSNINLELTAFVACFLPVMALYAFHFNKKMKRAMRQSKDRIGDINAQVEDTLAGIRVVQSFTNEAVEEEKFARENKRFLASKQDVSKSEAYFHEGLIGMTQLMTVIVVIFGSVGIVNGSLELADLIPFLLYIGILIEPINRFGNFTRLYQEGITGFERFMEVLEVEPDIQDTPGAVDLPAVRGTIEFRGVCFKYKNEQNEVLKNISLTIQAGEYVALVGASGVGKTTLCSLIPRFYDANAGEILIDGVPIRTVTQRSLRRQIGVVQQDVYLFAGTVADNIRYGKPGACDEEIIEAAKKANAHDFIMALPHGYATDIGERGVKLSGGQKQRLSIARVFLKDPPILIFDEATSALDNESERAVRESLERLTRSRTTLVIAHRLSTIRNAQRIMVLEGGCVAEMGTHGELIARNGVYAHLYTMQLTL